MSRAAGLPTELYRAASVGAIERAAIERCSIPDTDLMERAGAAAFARIREQWPAARSVVVVCGTGNNGGDGFVVARLAAHSGLATRVVIVGDERSPRGASEHAYRRMVEVGVAPDVWPHGGVGVADVVVDALLGTGLARDLAGPHAAAVRAMNDSAAPTLAIDLPSGLHADSGRVLGDAVRAAATVTFVGLKRGLFTGAARAHRGALHFDTLGIPASVFDEFPIDARRVDLAALGRVLGPRERGAHKGRFGHVLVIGGDQGFAGAVRLAGEAAGRVGAGLVSVATRAEHVGAIVSARPELMCHPAEDPEALGALAERATVVAVGPGLGRGEWGKRALDVALASGRPLVIDADALNLIAEDGGVIDTSVGDDRVHTPHPGEAARLLACSVREVEADRFAAIDALVARYGGVWLLKGAGTLVGAAHRPTAVCEGGNPGMASGGMGDTLTGAIAGLMAQGLASDAATVAGACLHGAAGDAAARDGERGTLAGDLLPHLRRLVNAL